MKRKVIQIADSTQLISLPRKWTLKYNIKKGDEIEVEEQGNKVVISTENNMDKGTVEINPPHLKNITERYITVSFRAGVDEIKINYDSAKNPELLEYINKTLDGQTIGYEIIKQERNLFIIKDLSGNDTAGFDTALRRSFSIISSLATDSVEAVRKKDSHALRDMYIRDRSINKFTNFCCRLLLTKGEFDLKKTAFYYHFIRSLEDMADQYSLMSTYYEPKPGRVHNSIFESFETVNQNLFELFELYYNYDKVKLNELFMKIKSLDLIIPTLFKLPNNDPVIVYYLLNIHLRIKELIVNLIELNLENG